MSLACSICKKALPSLLALSVLGTAFSFASASPSAPEFGHVHMQGSIIDTPCAISTADIHQSIEMSVSTVGEMVLNGRGSQKAFSLNLVNCDLNSHSQEQPDSTHFSTTFDGPSDHGLFRISGAEGVGLQITDALGHPATPGQPLPSGSLVPGTQRLDYILRLVSNDQPLKVGEYHAILRFKVDYF
ncbi:type 1 fimbrial protein [Rahnella sp. PD12R]|uniref:fimbrial protein n=1 Tax=Rahnella sp. PD12R TaxID=2855688 RepID=UPI001C43E38E|nr:fimbrial protein [Rahnella sp. PD12R]MBV6819329.1 type 1 fimbrial protein [Rahnella sp. PD12R]